MVHVFHPGRPGAPTLVLLHGTGGDEHSLLPLARNLLPEANLLGLRGRVLEHGAPRFFRRFAEGVLDLDDWRARSLETADAIAEAGRRHGFAPARTCLLGYSNGANLAVGLLLLRPEVLAGAVLLRPMFVSTVEETKSLAGKPVLIGYGLHDPLLAPGDIDRLQRQLLQVGADVALHAEEAGHGLGPGDPPAVRAWLEKHFSA